MNKGVEKINKNLMKIILEKSDTGFSAYAQNEKAIYTAGETYEEVRENILEVIEYRIEYLKEIGKLDEAKRLTAVELEYYLDVQQFFDQYSMINKSKFANFIGMNPSLMRKLSKGIVALSDNKAKQIEDGLHRLAGEFSKVHFV